MPEEFGNSKIRQEWYFKTILKMLRIFFLIFFWNCSIILGKKREKLVLFPDYQKKPREHELLIVIFPTYFLTLWWCTDYYLLSFLYFFSVSFFPLWQLYLIFLYQIEYYDEIHRQHDFLNNFVASLISHTKNQAIYNIIHLFAGPMGQTTHQPSVWHSKYIFFIISKLFIFIFVIL